MAAWPSAVTHSRPVESSVTSRLISPAEAEAAIRAHAAPLPATSLPLTELVGTILRERIVAACDQPPFDRVTMDGIAFAFAAYERGQRAFRIAGTQAAGAPPLIVARRRTLHRSDDGRDAARRLRLRGSGREDLGRGRRRAADDPTRRRSASRTSTRAALDSRRGDALLAARDAPRTRRSRGARRERAHARVASAAPPRIVVISTGDELVEPGKPLAQWQISSLERLRGAGRAAPPRFRATDARSPARRSCRRCARACARISRRTTC